MCKENHSEGANILFSWWLSCVTQLCCVFSLRCNNSSKLIGFSECVAQRETVLSRNEGAQYIVRLITIFSAAFFYFILLNFFFLHLADLFCVLFTRLWMWALQNCPVKMTLWCCLDWETCDQKLSDVSQHDVVATCWAAGILTEWCFLFSATNVSVSPYFEIHSDIIGPFSLFSP